MAIDKRLLAGVSHDAMPQATQRKLFFGNPLFLVRMWELDEYINGDLHCTYKLQDECGVVIAYYGSTPSLAFETAMGDGYNVHWAH